MASWLDKLIKKKGNDSEEPNPDELDAVFGKKDKAAQSVAQSASKSVSRSELADHLPRRLTPLDAPVIMGRLRALGFYDAVPEKYHGEFKIQLMEQCKDKPPQLWWWPLARYTNLMKFGHDADTIPFRLIDLMVYTVDDLITRIIPLEGPIRGTGFTLRHIIEADGERASAAQTIEGEAVFGVAWRCRGKGGALPVRVKKNKVRIRRTVRAFNKALADCMVPYRVMILPPFNTMVGLMYVPATIAGRASKWGYLE